MVTGEEVVEDEKVEETNPESQPAPLTAQEVSQGQQFLQDLKNLATALSEKIVTENRKLAIDAVKQAIQFLDEELTSFSTTADEAVPAA